MGLVRVTSLMLANNIEELSYKKRRKRKINKMSGAENFKNVLFYLLLQSQTILNVCFLQD